MSNVSPDPAVFDNLGDGEHTGRGGAITHTSSISDEERESIRAQIRAEELERIKAEGGTSPAAAAGTGSGIGAAAATPAVGLPSLTRIHVEEGDHIPPGGQPIGHNGTVYLLKPGIDQDVPDAILNILDDAIVEKPILSNDGMKIIGQRKMLRFPYRVVRS